MQDQLTQYKTLCEDYRSSMIMADCGRYAGGELSAARKTLGEIKAMQRLGIDADGKIYNEILSRPTRRTA